MKGLLSLPHRNREPSQTQTPERRIRAEQHRDKQICRPFMQGTRTHQTAQNTTQAHKVANRTQGGRAHMQHTTRTQGAMERNQATSGHINGGPRCQSGARKNRPCSATEFRRPRHAIVRYSHHWMCVPLIKGQVRVECSSNTSRPATTARSGEERVHRTTTPDRPTEDPQRGQNPSQNPDFRDRAIEYSANATSTCRRTPSPDSTEYSTGNTVYTVYSTKLLAPARCHDTMNDQQQQQQQVTALTTEAVQSQDDHTRDEQRPTGSCNIQGTSSDRPMTLSQTSAHSSIMDVDATNAEAPADTAQRPGHPR